MPGSLARIKKELNDPAIANSYHNFCPVKDNEFHITAIIVGPEGSPYERCVLVFHLHFPANYPFVCPRIQCEQRVYHMNFTHREEKDMNTNDNIILNQLQNYWSPRLTMLDIVQTIEAQLGEPYIGNNSSRINYCLNQNLLNQYKNHRRKHDEIALRIAKEEMGYLYYPYPPRYRAHDEKQTEVNVTEVLSAYDSNIECKWRRRKHFVRYLMMCEFIDTSVSGSTGNLTSRAGGQQMITAPCSEKHGTDSISGFRRLQIGACKVVYYGKYRYLEKVFGCKDLCSVILSFL